MALLRGFGIEFRVGIPAPEFRRDDGYRVLPSLREHPCTRAAWVNGKLLLCRGRGITRARSNRVVGASLAEEEVEWTVQDSDSLYRLHSWGAPYFAINAAGHLCVRPSGCTEGRQCVYMFSTVLICLLNPTTLNYRGLGFCNPFAHCRVLMGRCR